MVDPSRSHIDFRTDTDNSISDQRARRELPRIAMCAGQTRTFADHYRGRRYIYPWPLYCRDKLKAECREQPGCTLSAGSRCNARLMSCWTAILNFASVIYISASPACSKNRAFALRQAMHFHDDRSAPAFAQMTAKSISGAARRSTI
jgi:hypothetical protein